MSTHLPMGAPMNLGHGPVPGLPSFSTSLAALENQVRTITTMASQMRTGEELNLSTKRPSVLVNGDRSPASPSPSSSARAGRATPASPARSASGRSLSEERELRALAGSRSSLSPPGPPGGSLAGHLLRPPSSQPPASPSPSESGSQGALDLTPKSSGSHHSGHSAHSAPGSSPPVGPLGPLGPLGHPHGQHGHGQIGVPSQPQPLGPPPGLFSGFGLPSGLLPPHVGAVASGSSVSPGALMTSALSSLTSSVLTSTAFSPMGFPGMAPAGKCKYCHRFTCRTHPFENASDSAGQSVAYVSLNESPRSIPRYLAERVD